MLDRASHDPDLFAALSGAAADEAAGAPLDSSVAALLGSGLLDEPDPERLAGNLVRIAEANLPVARLAEGHVNALALIGALGEAPRPGLHGVWGADGDPPVRIANGRLAGVKRFASGLGLCRHAVILVGGGPEARLALVPVGDEARHRPETWAMTGMEATASGDIDLSGLAPEWLGPPGAYFREPSFLGGTWRIAALQLGGALGLIGAARDRLAALRRLEAEAQVARLAPLVGRAMAGFGLVERAAATASGPDGAADPDRAVALSLQSRLLTEDLAQDTIAAVERAIGLQHFHQASETGRRARDLACYCRQATRDAFEQKAARIALGRSGPLSDLWHG
jgi:hypothetical protein